jgi:hypothetical protein
VSIDFGIDICLFSDTDDADELWSEVSGVALVRQDLRLRLQTDQLLYNATDLANGLEIALDSADWGFDLNRLAGATTGTAANYQGRIKRVVLKDQRIQSADVTITEATSNGLTTLTITIACMTALGPFRLVFMLDPSQPTGAQLTVITSQ